MADCCPAERMVCPAPREPVRQAVGRLNLLNHWLDRRCRAAVVNESARQRRLSIRHTLWRRFMLSSSLKRWLRAVVMLAAAPLAAAPGADDRRLAGTPVQARSAQLVDTVSLGGVIVPYREVTLAAQLPLYF